MAQSTEYSGAAQPAYSSEEKNAPPFVQIVWQVDYAVRDVSYWWDYTKDVCELLEGAREKDTTLSFTRRWPKN